MITSTTVPTGYCSLVLTDDEYRAWLDLMLEWEEVPPDERAPYYDRAHWPWYVVSPRRAFVLKAEAATAHLIQVASGVANSFSHLAGIRLGEGIQAGLIANRGVIEAAREATDR